MKNIFASDLKTILHSKRANIFYLEHCRVLVNAGRVEYVTKHRDKLSYFNIPIANTTTILLGSGTSITQSAVRELAKAGVMIGFCGGGGTPLYAGTEYPAEPIKTEYEMPIDFIQPQSEYRPTQYVQQWLSFWFDNEVRLKSAKHLQLARLAFLKKAWAGNNELNPSCSEQLNILVSENINLIESSCSVDDLLLYEARLTKKIYQLIAMQIKYGEFTRQKHGEGKDAANRFLDYGNYLAYGLAASALWVLGIPHSFALLHGKTRRGALVFDVADIIKDALILPQAFVSAQNGDTDQQFRIVCTNMLVEKEALDYMIETLKEIAIIFCKNK